MDENRTQYRTAVNQMGKKEFTLLKMQEYGFWPADLPTPYEKQKNETAKDYNKRKDLFKEYEKIAKQIADLYEEKGQINAKLRMLSKQYDQTWDYDRIRNDVAKKIMQESIARRAERKQQKEQEKIRISEAWNKRKQNEIVFIGKGYSGFLSHKANDIEKLSANGMPIVMDDKTLANILGIEYKDLRSLVYHRDVVTVDHYHRYSIEKRKGGERQIAAPKPVLKEAQKKILSLILERMEISKEAHGFTKGRSVVTGANIHGYQPQLLINMDLLNFFPTITFQRVRGMFHSFGYSGYIASLLAMICTYCERMEMEIKGEKKYVKTSKRILPQGSPASPMITNIICRSLDEKLCHLARQYQVVYSRYADDMSFSFETLPESDQIRSFVGQVHKIIRQEGFYINKAKTRYLRQNNRQCITGVIVNNQELGVPKGWVKRMRAAIFNARKMKLEKEVPQTVINELMGMTAWLKTVNATRYEKIIRDAENLLAECKKS